MEHNVYVYIFIMAAVSYAIRCPAHDPDPKAHSQPVLSSPFLYYVPYVTLAVRTFPAIVEATQSPFGAAALIGWADRRMEGASLIAVAGACCGTVFLLELLLI